MTRRQKLELRASEIRTRLAELGGLEEHTDETRSETDKLRNEYGDTERRIGAFTIADDEPVVTEQRSEDRELAALIADSSLGTIFGNVLEHRSTSGREGELQVHYGLAGDQVPLQLLEDRAVTAAPGQVGQNQAEIIAGVFPQSCAAFLGIDLPTVGVGESVYPVLTKNATVHTPAENAAAAETTGTFSAEVLSPARLQASFFFSREDRGRFAGMSEALRSNLSEALSDSLDLQVLAGTNGLLTGTNLPNHVVSAATTYALYRDQLAYGRVDGTYAMTVADLRVVMGSATYAHAAKAFRSDNAGDRAALEDLMAVTGGIKVSSHVPAVVSTKQNAVIRLGARRDMVAPVWQGITLIPDEITLAANGQIKITAVMLFAVKIVRTAGFFKQQVQIT